MAQETLNIELLPKEAAQLYFPGRYLIFTKDSSDLTKGYLPEDISIMLVQPPALSSNMQRIWDERYAKKFPNGIKRDGKFPGMLCPSSTVGTLGLPIFQSGFLDWNLTLPWGDEHDSKLEAGCMRPFFNLHHVPITQDGYMIFGMRSNSRLSWHDSYLCTHSWGSDIDKDYGCAKVLADLETGQGTSLFSQARDGVIREINPFEDSGSSAVPNRVLEEILSPDDVEVLSANCLTIPASPKDLGYHLCFTTKVSKDAAELIAARNKHPFPGRISCLHSVPFNPDSMRKFFQDYEDKVAMTIEPAIILACVQAFGESFLKCLPYVSVRQ